MCSVEGGSGPVSHGHSLDAAERLAPKSGSQMTQTSSRVYGNHDCEKAIPETARADERVRVDPVLEISSMRVTRFETICAFHGGFLSSVQRLECRA